MQDAYRRLMDDTSGLPLLALMRDRKAGRSLVADYVEEGGSAQEVLRRGGLQIPTQGELFAPDEGTDAELSLDESRT